jgi:uncharacterized protein (TIGR03435 family)
MDRHVPWKRLVGRTVASLLGAFLVLALLWCGLTLQVHTRASAAWKEFSIGPAYGRSATVNPGMIRSDGITLKTAMAVAYGMPAVRIIGPLWLGETRYSINTVVDDLDSFHSLLKQELKSRLRLVTHIENRPFDVFVLTATGAPQLEPTATGQEPRTWIHDSDAQLEGASMERLAAALQSILDKPVIDETGISGRYNLRFAWGAHRVTSVTSVIHDRFGLQLAAGKRDMEALIIDSVEPEAALSLLAQVGRLTARTPPRLRQRLSNALAIR